MLVFDRTEVALKPRHAAFNTVVGVRVFDFGPVAFVTCRPYRLVQREYSGAVRV